MQGDQVLVEVEPPKADGRRMGRIVRVLERRNPTVVGVFHYARSDARMGKHRRPLRRAHDAAILIPEGQELPEAVRIRHAASRAGRRGDGASHAHHAWKAWSSMWRSPVGPRRRGRRSAA
jgi:exoribonuclease R